MWTVQTVWEILMPNKDQITVTLEPDHIKYVKALAKKMYEGNDSMAFRKIIADHSRLINDKVKH